LKSGDESAALQICRPLKRALFFGGVKPGVARCALTPGYLISRFQREEPEQAPTGTDMILKLGHHQINENLVKPVT
jgi:hypothetical protein